MTMVKATRRPSPLQGHPCFRWTIAIVGAALLNGILFLLLPALVISSGEKLQTIDAIPAVNVIRIRHKETPPRRREQPPPPKPEEKRPEEKPKTLEIQFKQPKLTIPFQLSPEMPSAPSSIEFSHLQVGKTLNLDGALDGVEMSQLDNPLIPLSQIPPIYPMRAKRLGLSGSVKLRFMVNEQGLVENITVVESHPEGVFDNSAIQCVKQWRFRPGTLEGVPVRVWAELPISFQLEK